MHRQQGSVYRGLYGPHPAALIASALLWRQRLAAWSAALRFALLFLCGNKQLEPAAPDELAHADRQQLRFRPLVPSQAPRGYRLSAFECVPDCTDLLILTYRAGCARSFTISQRPKWLPVGEELRLARVPATPVRGGSVPMFVVHGVYTGEPIDRAYSARRRRSVAFELGGLAIELREVTGQGPGLRGLIAMARGMAEQFGCAQRLKGNAGQDLPADPLPAAVQSS